MDILEELKRERTPAAEVAASDPAVREEASEELQRAMESLYPHLERLAQGLRDLNPDIRVDYEVPMVGTLAQLRQGEYAVETLDPLVPRFAFRFSCAGGKALNKAASSVEQKNIIREQIEALDLTAQIDDMSTWRYVVSIKPVVPVKLVFEPCPDGNEIRMTAHNLDGFGQRYYTLHPDVVNEQLCNEIGKLVLRRENRFAEYAGNRVAEDIRARFKERIEKRKQSREEVQKAVQAESEPKGGRIKKLFGLVGGKNGNGQATSRPAAPGATAATKAPVLDGGAGGAHNGFIDWNGPGAEPEPAPAKKAASAPAPAAAPAAEAANDDAPPPYCWMITGDMQADSTGASVGRYGPSGSRRRFSSVQMLEDGERFRLLDRGGEIRFNGMIIGEYQGIEPLVDFGIERQCYVIQYERNGEWVRVRPTD